MGAVAICAAKETDRRETSPLWSFKEKLSAVFCETDEARAKGAEKAARKVWESVPIPRQAAKES